MRREYQPTNEGAGTAERVRAKGEETAGSKPAGQPWTRMEDSLLRDMLDARLTAIEIAQRLARTPTAIYSRVQYLDRKHRKSAAS
jgi:hypothetical protein